MVAMPTPWKHPKTGTYYFRRAVPADVRDKLGWEVKTSLRTKSASEAKRLYAAEFEKFERAVELARKDFDLSERAAKALAGEWLRAALDADERRRDRGEGEPMWDEVADVTAYELDLEQMQAASEGRRRALVAAEVAAVMKEKGLPLAKDAPGYGRLVDELFWAKVRLLSIMNRRERGDWARADVVDDYPHYFPPSETTKAPRKATPKGAQGETLRVLFEAWNVERKPAPKTVVEFEKAVRRFEEFHGVIGAASISKAMVRDFKSALMRFPRALSRKLRGMTMPDVLAAVGAASSIPVLTAGSVNKHVTAIATVLEWAALQGYFDADPNWSNPASGMRVRGGKSDDEKRLSYDADDLRIIFTSPVFSKGMRPVAGAGEAAKWLPLMALFTGARVEELGQLLVSDVRQDGAIWYLDINTRDEGKRLKNRSSHRLVPIHPELERAGFLEYVALRRKQGNGARLFPELRPDKHGHLTNNWSKWWGRYAREQGITDKRKVFHSFRHTFKTACRAAGIPKEIHDRLTGHTSGDVGDEYGDKHPVAVLAHQMRKIKYKGLQLS